MPVDDVLRGGRRQWDRGVIERREMERTGSCRRKPGVRLLPDGDVRRHARLERPGAHLEWAERVSADEDRACGQSRGGRLLRLADTLCGDRQMGRRGDVRRRALECAGGYRRRVPAPSVLPYAVVLL